LASTFTESKDKIAIQPLRNRHIDRSFTVAVYVFAAVVVLVSIALLISTLEGVKEVAILSGSMQPLWARGELLFMVREPASAVRVGQAILYHPPAQYFNADVVHRVISIRSLGNGSYLAHTKGVANPVRDPWKDTLSGYVYHVVYKLPYLGFVSIMLHDGKLLTIIFGIVVILLVIAFVRRVSRHTAQHSKKVE